MTELHARTTTDPSFVNSLYLISASLVYDAVWTAANTYFSAPMSNNYPDIINTVHFHGASVRHKHSQKPLNQDTLIYRTHSVPISGHFDIQDTLFCPNIRTLRYTGHILSQYQDTSIYRTHCSVPISGHFDIQDTLFCPNIRTLRYTGHILSKYQDTLIYRTHCSVPISGHLNMQDTLYCPNIRTPQYAGHIVLSQYCPD